MGVLNVKAFPQGHIYPNNATCLPDPPKQIHQLGAMYQLGAKYQMYEPMWEVLFLITTKKKERNIIVC